MIRPFFATRQTGAARALLLASVCAALVTASAPAVAKRVYVTFDFPGASQTLAFVVNRNVEVAGDWIDADQVEHGYLRAADGTISSIDAPGAMYTEVGDMNDSQLVVGGFVDQSNALHGFLRAAYGTISPYDVPEGVGNSTVINAVNNKGVFTGSYISSGKGIYFGFIQNPKGKFKSFNIGDSVDVEPLSINDTGVVTGWYNNSGDVVHGFVRASNGAIATFDPAGSVETLPLTINSSGVIVGRYYDAARNIYSFVRAADGTITTISDPQGAKGTAASFINDKNEIVGRFVDAGAQNHGFALSSNGSFKNFDPKGSTGTYASGVNNKGVIVGDYLDEDGVAHGYLRMSSMGAGVEHIAPSHTTRLRPAFACAMDGRAPLCRPKGLHSNP